MLVKCTSCGANQDLNEASNCGYCGNLIEIESAVDFYKSSLSGEVGNLMAMAETASEAGNWEEAISYYNRTLEKDLNNSDAWLGKGIAVILSSKIGDIKSDEAISYWKNAIKHNKNQEAIKKRVANIINNTVVDFYPVLENNYREFKTLDTSYREFINRFLILERALDFAIGLDNDNLLYYENGRTLCINVISAFSRFNNSKSQVAGLDAKTNEMISAIDSMRADNAVPEELYQIEAKYTNGINRLDPEKNLITYKEIRLKEDEEKKLKKEKSEQERIEELKKSQTNPILASGISVFVFLIFLAFNDGFKKIPILVLIVGLTGIFFGIYIYVKEKNKADLKK